MFAAGTGNVAGLQVLLDKQANPTVEDYQATLGVPPCREQVECYRYPTCLGKGHSSSQLP